MGNTPAEAPSGSVPSLEGLALLQREFPAHRIWVENGGRRIRYVARGLRLGVHPYAIVTGDLAELRAVLAAGSCSRPVTVPYDPAVPNIARMYNYWTGGKDHQLADRQAADSVLADFPEVATIARANRDFVTRAVAWVAAEGISQFLDIGVGLPAEPTVHQIAQRVNPAARTVYADNDRLVITHARALLAGPGVEVVPGDLRDPASILADAAKADAIDLGKPVCVLLAAVLHFLSPDEADAAVATFTSAVVPGSYLIVSAGTSTGTDPALLSRLRTAYSSTSIVTGRTASEIEAWFDGLELVPPGVVDVQAWRPGCRLHPFVPVAARILGGVGRKAHPEYPQAVADDYPGWHITCYDGQWTAQCPALALRAPTAAPLRAAIERAIGDEVTRD
jgi:O-methyltransferase involved in polyketide biosynthesis